MMNFYQEALGFQTLYQFPEAGSATFGTSKLGTFYVTFATYKAIRESTSIPSIGRASQRQMDIAILVDDVDAAVARAEAAGAKLAMAPKEQPWGERQAFVYDPEKNLVQISTHRGG